MTGILAGLIGSFASVPSGAYELLATANGTGSSGVITISSIPQDYKHLQIRYTAKNSSASSQMNIRMNSITSGVYMRHTLRGNGTAASSTASGTSQTSIQLVEAIANSTVANAVNAGVIDILDYTSTTKNKTIRVFCGMADNLNRLQLSSGFYNQTTAVTSISFIASSGNFASISRFSLYGIKG